MKGFFIFPVLLILLFGTPAVADYQKGSDAAQKGVYATALKEWKPLAEQGNAGAQYNLGIMYHEGRCVTQDDKAAIKWLTKAAEQGLVIAQYELALMYNNGEGVTQNYKMAVKWYEVAAEQGYVHAQNDLGLM